MAKRTLSKFSTTQLHLELKRRQMDVVRLETKRNRLTKELNQIEKQIASFGGMSTGTVAAAPTVKRAKKTTTRTRKTKSGLRPKNRMTLSQAIEKVINGPTLSVTEITSAVKKVGYKTKAENFRTIVNQTLIKNPRRFKKVARGMYTLSS